MPPHSLSSKILYGESSCPAFLPPTSTLLHPRWRDILSSPALIGWRSSSAEWRHRSSQMSQRPPWSVWIQNAASHEWFGFSKSFKYLALKGGDVKYFDKEFVDLPVLHSEILWFTCWQFSRNVADPWYPLEAASDPPGTSGHRGCELRSRRRGSPSGREPLRGKMELGNRMEIRSVHWE